jgi:hypothetical protein
MDGQSQMQSQIPDEDPNFGGVETPADPTEKVATYGGVPTSQAHAGAIAQQKAQLGGASSEHPAHRAIEDAIREVAKLKTTHLTAQTLVHLTNARSLIQEAIYKGALG